MHDDLRQIHHGGRVGRKRAERKGAVPVERAGRSPRCDVGRGRVGERHHRIVVADAGRVLADGLALVDEREHPGGADQVIERGPHVPLRARGRQRELRGVDVGDDLCCVFVGIVECGDQGAHACSSISRFRGVRLSGGREAVAAHHVEERADVGRAARGRGQHVADLQ